MAKPFIFRCPTTGQYIQGYSEREELPRSREPGATGEFLFHPPPERPTVPNTDFLGQ
jgi:hypothetical protein